tara:strand:- start:4836 stop:5501 length:666 start_codon:yes stop_codon:yes gene_type:complete
MPAVNIFDTLRARVEASDGIPPQQRRAINWFRNYHSELTNWQSTNARQTFQQVSNNNFAKRLVPPRLSFPGYLYFFMYKPLAAETLPVYDRFPLVLVLERFDNGFLGLNLHYLPYRSRAIFFDALYSSRFIASKDPLRARINVSYKILKSVAKYRAFNPCIHRYHHKGVKTPLLQVGETEWDLALFLPVERFAKMQRSDVWNRSLRSLDDDIASDDSEEFE